VDERTPTIIRAPRGTQPYFMMLRETAQDARLTFEARGVLAYLLSKPDDWRIDEGDLMREGGVGRDKVRRILRELKQTGYLHVQQARNANNTFAAAQFELHEKPLTEKPSTENPLTAQPSTENPTHTYKEILQNTEKAQNTETPCTPPTLVETEERAAADAAADTQPESKLGFRVGQPVYYAAQTGSWGGTIAKVEVLQGTVQGFTDQRVRVEFADGVKTLKPSSIKAEPPKLERKTSPLQDVIAELSLSIPPGVPVGRDAATRLNAITGELGRQCQARGQQMPELDEMRLIYTWWDTKGINRPTKPESVSKMVFDYRNEKGNSNGRTTFGPGNPLSGRRGGGVPGTRAPETRSIVGWGNGQTLPGAPTDAELLAQVRARRAAEIANSAGK